MAKAACATVDEYLALQPEPVRRALERVRAALRAALPGAEELISYKIPTYKLRGKVVLYFAGWTHHYSIYPASERLVAAFASELEPYEVKGSTLRFPLSAPVPEELIGRIARFRLEEGGAPHETV